MPVRRTTASGYEHAKIFRKGLTPAESKLGEYLRGNKLNGVYFSRQHAIGKYVPDFCAIKAKLFIELGGSQHLGQDENDMERTKYLREKGYKVLRFWNDQVINNIEEVLHEIDLALETE